MDPRSLLISLPLLWSQGAPPAPELVPVHLRVERPDGTLVRPGTRGMHLYWRVEKPDERGWPMELHPHVLAADDPAAAGENWTSLAVAPDSTLQVALLLPPHALLEETFAIGSAAQGPRRLRLRLGPEVTVAPLRVEPSPDTELPRRYSFHPVSVHGPRTGIYLRDATLAEAASGLRLPVGAYEVRLRDHWYLMCGNTPPPASDFVPAKRRVVLAETGADLVLATTRGSRLALRVDLATGPGRRPPSGGAPSTEGAGGETLTRGAPLPPHLVRARLHSTQGTELLEWGWHTLPFAIPEQAFPLGTDVYQISPVPCGSYTLELTGPAIEPLRVPVQLGPDLETPLRLHVQPRR